MKRTVWRALGALLAAVVLLGALPLSAGAFADVEAGAWYADAINEMAGEGYLLGYPDGLFRPGEAVSIGQFLTIAGRCAGVSPDRKSVV